MILSIVSSFEVQALKMFNMTPPEPFDNQTTNQISIPIEEDNIQTVVSMTGLWMGIVLGVYIILHLIKYLQNKPPALQSQLDIMYEIMFQSWILNGCMSLLTFTLPFLFGVPWALAVIIVWTLESNFHVRCSTFQHDPGGYVSPCFDIQRGIRRKPF